MGFIDMYQGFMLQFFTSFKQLKMIKRCLKGNSQYDSPL